jgi:molecular chaperone IbpA
MTHLSTIDTAALNKALNRSLIGFDRMFGEFADHYTVSTNYPPHNVYRKDEDNYAIEIAVAGFSLDDIEIEVDQNRLTVKGTRQKSNDTHEYLHRGLALRDFEQSFTLAAHIVVMDARIKDGILTIDLQHQLPDALKPRKVAISKSK